MNSVMPKGVEHTIARGAGRVGDELCAILFHAPGQRLHSLQGSTGISQLISASHPL